MRILSWLFGQKEKSSAAVREQRTPVATQSGKSHAAGERASRESAPPATRERRGAEDRETENLRRWKETGQARRWVEAHHGQWNHDDWLALLEELKQSSLWPMHPDMVGLALEDARREWLNRN